MIISFVDSTTHATPPLALRPQIRGSGGEEQGEGVAL